MRSLIKAFARSNGGATAIEYGLIAAMIVVVIIGALAALSSENGGLWSGIRDKVIPALDGTLGQGGEGED